MDERKDHNSFYRSTLWNDIRFNHNLTRVDVFRLIASIDISSVYPQVVGDDVSCTPVAPLHVSELDNLSDAQWKVFQTLLINMGTEGAPSWIVLNKRRASIGQPMFQIQIMNLGFLQIFMGICRKL